MEIRVITVIQKDFKKTHQTKPTLDRSPSPQPAARYCNQKVRYCYEVELTLAEEIVLTNETTLRKHQKATLGA